MNTNNCTIVASITNWRFFVFHSVTSRLIIFSCYNYQTYTLNTNQKKCIIKKKKTEFSINFSRTIILDPKLILIHFASPLRFSIFVVGMWLQWSVVNFYQKWNFPPCVLNWVKNRLNYFASWPLFSNSCSTSRFDWKMRFLVIWPQKRKCWFDFRTSTHATLKKQQQKIWKTQ